MAIFGPREIMRSEQIKRSDERSDSNTSERSADETLRYRESNNVMSDTAPRPPDRYERLCEWLRERTPHEYREAPYEEDGERFPGLALQQIPSAHDPASLDYHPSPLPCPRCELEAFLGALDGR